MTNPLKRAMAAVDRLIEGDIDKSIAERPIPTATPIRKLLGASVEAEAKDNAKALEILTKTKRLIEDEITRLAGELRNTDVALAARAAMNAVLQGELDRLSAERFDAATAAFDTDIELDFDKPLALGDHTSPERRLEEYASRLNAAASAGPTVADILDKSKALAESIRHA